ILVGWLFQQADTRRGATVVVPEDARQVRQEVREAFREQKPLGADETAAELKPLFDDLGNAFRTRDAANIIDAFDTERMFDELTPQSGVPPATARDRATVAAAIRQRLARTLSLQAPLLSWTTTDIRNVKFLPEGDAVVIARHQMGEVSLKKRWW